MAHENRDSFHSVFFISLLFCSLLSCTGDGELYPDMFDVTGLTCGTYRVTLRSDSTSGILRTSEPSLPYDSFALGVFARYEEYYSTHSYYGGYGILPGAGNYGYRIPRSEEVIAGLVVFSNSAYDSAHPAGDSLNDLLDVFMLYPADDGPYRTPFALTDFLSEKRTARQRVVMTLRSPPAQAAEHEFTLVYRQTNGEVYTATARRIVVTPY